MELIQRALPSILFIVGVIYLIGGFFTVCTIFFVDIFKQDEDLGIKDSIKKNMDRSIELSLILFLPITLVVVAALLILYLFGQLLEVCFCSVDTVFKDLSGQESYTSRMLKNMDSEEKEGSKDILDEYIDETQKSN
jgi:hypothetical protein